MDLYLLRFPAGLHLGAGTGELGRVDPLPRSDTLTAALLTVWRHVDPSADIARLAADPPFSVSSGLPWHWREGDAEPEWLLPVPPGTFDGVSDPSLRKALRRLRFAAPEHLGAIVRGATPSADDPRLVMGRTLWLTRPPGDDWLYRTEVTTRLSVDRLTGGPVEGALFLFARTRFRDDATTRAGVAVLAELRDEGLRGRFEAALELLGLEGLGGDRSVGLGHFEVVERRRATLPDLGRGARLLLSLTVPRHEAVRAGLLEPPARYELVERGGWVTASGAGSLRRRRVRMLAEGSLLPHLPGPVGRAVEVLPPDPARGLPHPVYRGGEPLSLELAPDRWAGGGPRG